MRKSIRSIIVTFILSTILLINIFSVYAENDLQVLVSETLAVSLVIDTSGSMSETDSNNLRQEAANLFVDLLGAEDYIGVITFNTTVSEVVPIQQVGETEERKSIKEKFTSLTESEGDTNYTLALNAASVQLSEINDGNVKKVIIFITDGAPDPDRTKLNDQDFMNNYMDTLWSSVDQLALKQYPVYAVGFSDGIRTDVLSQIADDTGGNLKILSDSSALASSFFQILGELKNREELLNENANITASGYEFSINLNENTTQSTIVIINHEGTDYNIEIRDSSGNIKTSEVAINKTSGYTVIRLNNNGINSEGTYSVKLIGSGNVEVLADRDLTLKSWLLSPVPSREYKLGEPVEIKVKVTGEVQRGVSVSVDVKNPTGETQTIVLEETDSIFQGLYEDTEVIGEYNITTNVKLNGENISSKTEKFNVGILPDLKTSFYINSEGYRIGEEISMSAWLTYEGSRLINGQSIGIDRFILRVANKNGSVTDIPMLDNGEEANNDTLNNDGIWSGKIELSEEGEYEIFLIVSGTFQNNSYMIEEEFGGYVVKEAGIIKIKCTELNTKIKSGGIASVPVTFYNDSEFEEVLQIFTDSEQVDYEGAQIVMAPGESKEYLIELAVKQGTALGVYGIKIGFEAENTKTVIDAEELKVSVEVVTAFNYYLYKIGLFVDSAVGFIEKLFINIIALSILLILIIILTGRLICKRKYYLMTRVKGTLEYWKEGQLKENSQTITFDDKKKDIIIVSFSEKNKKADFHIKGTRFNYDLVFSVFNDKGRFSMLNYCRKIISKSTPYKNIVMATPPGIIEKDGEIYTRLFLNEDEFISGGYNFYYHIKKRKRRRVERKGKNILEDIDAESRSV